MSISAVQYGGAKADVNLANAIIESNTKVTTRLQDLISRNQTAGVSTAALEEQLARVNARTVSAQEKLTAANNIISQFENQTTVPSASDSDIQEKYEKAEIVAPTTANQNESSEVPPPETSQNITEAGRTTTAVKGALPVEPAPATVNFKSMSGDDINTDMRVKIRVPENYLTTLTQGPNNELKNLKGIIFPYTPQIGIEHKAEYGNQNVIHSNYSQYFYQRSSVSPIGISGKFTVANETEAAIYISITHLLRALVKMRFGGSTGDADSGAPPPVCRLDAYGAFMMQNVPVSISSFKVDYPENVDYYTLGKKPGSKTNSMFEMTAVPVISTISITCIPMYSKDEIQKFNVTQWLGSKYIRKAGYL
jgi:hypothetical protein